MSTAVTETYRSAIAARVRLGYEWSPTLHKHARYETSFLRSGGETRQYVFCCYSSWRKRVAEVVQRHGGLLVGISPVRLFSEESEVGLAPVVAKIRLGQP